MTDPEHLKLRIRTWLNGSKDFHEGRILLTEISTNRRLIEELKEVEDEDPQSMLRREYLSRMIHLFNVHLQPQKYKFRPARAVINAKPRKKVVPLVSKNDFTFKQNQLKLIRKWFKSRKDYSSGIELLSKLTPKYNLIARLTAKQTKRNEEKLSSELALILRREVEFINASF